MSVYVRQSGNQTMPTHKWYDTDTLTPVINTWYTIMQLYNAVIRQFTFAQNNNEAGAKDTQIRITIDGVVWTGSKAGHVAGTSYFMVLSPITGALTILYSATGVSVGALDIQGKNILIEARCDTAVGTNQRMINRIMYQELGK